MNETRQELIDLIRGFSRCSAEPTVGQVIERPSGLYRVTSVVQDGNAWRSARQLSHVDESARSLTLAPSNNPRVIGPQAVTLIC